jgi:hypothetical protein
MARVFSYKLVRDFGFAPNPFHGYCTLATCKPQIRRGAEVGDLIVGCGSAQGNLAGRAIFAMEVEQKLTFREFWLDPRFHVKRPNFYASESHAYGDNIYQPTDGGLNQVNSHHSHEDGSTNTLNFDRDTSSDNVLISKNFIYWGIDAPLIPPELRASFGDDIYPGGRNYRSIFSQDLVAAAYSRFNQQAPRGYQGRPSSW